MSKVVVIGAGASGMLAAIVASAKNDVVLLEKNDKCGKKILLTGNGKCNYWNETITSDHYFTHHVDLLEEMISKEKQVEVFTYLTNLGIYPRIKNGYYYPYSNQASSVREILWKEIEKRNIKVFFECDVKKVTKEKDEFRIDSNKGKISAEKVILATGSMASPKTGSDGIGYEIAKSFSHTIYDVLPSLVQLKSNFPYLKELDGTKVDVGVSILVDGEKKKEEKGELLFTDYGVSGICVFNLSRYASISLKKGQNVELHINFVPFLDMSFTSWFTKRSEMILHSTIEETLESIFPYKLLLVFLKMQKIERSMMWNDLSKEQQNQFAKMLEDFTIKITGTNSYDRAQVCTGGIPLDEIDPTTFESKKIKGLSIVGELLDVDGDCGGYNLAFAFLSGYFAARGVSHD